MKIGVMGDTHGDKESIRRSVNMAPPVELWLHTGDHAEDALFLEELAAVPVTRVLGNCDFNTKTANIDEIFVLEGFKLWLTHGHRYMGHTHIEELAWWGRQLEADIVVYGHTHMPMFKYYGEVLLLNPGSTTSPRGASKAGFAVLTLGEGAKPQAEFIELPAPERRYRGIW